MTLHRSTEDTIIIPCECGCDMRLKLLPHHDFAPLMVVGAGIDEVTHDSAEKSIRLDDAGRQQLAAWLQAAEEAHNEPQKP